MSFHARLFSANFQRAAPRFEEDLNHPQLKDTIFVSHPKAKIIRFIHIRLDPQKRAVERLRLSEVFDGIDDCSDILIHEELLLLAEHPGFDREVAAHPALPREPVTSVGFRSSLL